MFKCETSKVNAVFLTFVWNVRKLLNNLPSSFNNRVYMGMQKCIVYLISVNLCIAFVTILAQWNMYVRNVNNWFNTRFSHAAFWEKNVIVTPINSMFHIRRSIGRNPITDTCIVEPVFDVYICCWVCKMDLLTARSFSAERWMSSVKADLKFEIPDSALLRVCNNNMLKTLFQLYNIKNAAFNTS